MEQNWVATQYQVTVIYSKRRIHQLYLWDEWSPYFTLFDALLKFSPEKAFIRSYQTFTHEDNWLAFGRMVWNEKNNRKWTMKYREPQYAQQTLEFYSTEIWTPDWNAAFNKNIPPAIFIKLIYEMFDPLHGFIIAINSQLYQQSSKGIDEILSAVSALFTHSRVLTTERGWADDAFPGGGFMGGLSDKDLDHLIEQIQRGFV